MKHLYCPSVSSTIGAHPHHVKMDGGSYIPVMGGDSATSPPRVHDNDTPTSQALATPIDRFRSSAMRGRNDSGYLSSSPALSISAGVTPGYDTDPDMTHFSGHDLDTEPDDVFDVDFETHSMTLYGDDSDSDSPAPRSESQTHAIARIDNAPENQYRHQVDLENVNINMAPGNEVDIDIRVSEYDDIEVGDGAADFAESNIVDTDHRTSELDTHSGDGDNQITFRTPNTGAQANEMPVQASETEINVLYPRTSVLSTQTNGVGLLNHVHDTPMELEDACVSATQYNGLGSFDEIDIAEHNPAIPGGYISDEEVANITNTVGSPRRALASHPIDIPRPSAPVPISMDYINHHCYPDDYIRLETGSDDYHAQYVSESNSCDDYHVDSCLNGDTEARHAGCAQDNNYSFIPIAATEAMDCTASDGHSTVGAGVEGAPRPCHPAHHQCSDHVLHRVRTLPCSLLASTRDARAVENSEEEGHDDVFNARQRSASLPLAPSIQQRRTPIQEVGRQLRLLSDEFYLGYANRRRARTLSLQSPAIPIHLHIDFRSGVMPWHAFRPCDAGPNLDQETQTDEQTRN